MFEIGWSELLVVGVVALLVVGPKELPALLRTIGRYAGMMRRQANEFRAQFDEAMRETELEQLKKDVENIKREAESSLRSAERSVEGELNDAKRELQTPYQTTAENAPSALESPTQSTTPEHEATEPQPSPPSAPPAGLGVAESGEKPPVNGSGAHSMNGSTAPPIEGDEAAKGGAEHR